MFPGVRHVSGVFECGNPALPVAMGRIIAAAWMLTMSSLAGCPPRDRAGIRPVPDGRDHSRWSSRCRGVNRLIANSFIRSQRLTLYWSVYFQPGSRLSNSPVAESSYGSLSLFPCFVQVTFAGGFIHQLP